MRFIGTGIAVMAALVATTATAASTPQHTMDQLRKTRVQAVVKAPGFPDWITSGFGSMWLANGNAIERIDPNTNKPAGYIATGTQPCEGLVAGFGSLWTVDCPTSSLLRVDPSSGAITARIPLPGTAPDGEGLLAIDPNAVWIPATPKNSVSSQLVRVDPSTNAVVATVTLPADSSGAAAGFGAIWVTSAKTGSVYRIDPTTNAVAATVKVHGSPRFIASGAGGVWSLNQADGSVSHISPTTNRVVATIRTNVPGSGGCIAAGIRRVWVTMPNTPFSEIVARSNRILGQWTGIGGDCIATSFGSVWLVNHDLKNVWRIRPKP